MIKYETIAEGGVTCFLARDDQGRVGSVIVDDGYVRSSDYHVPARLRERGEYDLPPQHCRFTDELTYCDGTSMRRAKYTTPADMFKEAAGWILHLQPKEG